MGHLPRGTASAAEEHFPASARKRAQGIFPVASRTQAQSPAARIAAEHIGASDLAPALENALDLPRQRVKKRARFFKIFLRPPHFGRGDEVHRVRHLLRAFDAFNVSADLLHARHVLSPHLLNFENFL